MSIHILGLRLGSVAPIQLSSATRRRILSVCTKVQATSAVLLSLFAVIHLSSPLMGLLHLGGDVNDRVDAVSRWMLLGRVAYQSSVGEVVLYSSIATHLVSGILGRIVKTCTQSAVPTATEQDLDLPSNGSHPISAWSEDRVKQSPRSALNVAHLSGYALSPVVLHHIYVNRLLPSSTHPAIAQISPSELDYSFVSFSLSHSNLAVRTLFVAGYAALIGAFATHIVYALPAIQRSLPRLSTTRKSSRPKMRTGRVWAASSIAALLLTSVVVITPLNPRTRLAISGLVRQRYDAVLRMAFPSRFLF